MSSYTRCQAMMGRSSRRLKDCSRKEPCGNIIDLTYYGDKTYKGDDGKYYYEKHTALKKTKSRLQTTVAPTTPT